MRFPALVAAISILPSAIDLFVCGLSSSSQSVVSSSSSQSSSRTWFPRSSSLSSIPTSISTRRSEPENPTLVKPDKADALKAVKPISPTGISPPGNKEKAAAPPISSAPPSPPFPADNETEYGYLAKEESCTQARGCPFALRAKPGRPEAPDTNPNDIDAQLKKECVLWSPQDPQCKGDKLTAINDFFADNGTRFALFSNPGKYFGGNGTSQNTSSPVDYARIKEWMHTEDCKDDHKTWLKDHSHFSFEEESCCRGCMLTGGNVEIYYWPEEDADTSCQSIIGDEVLPQSYGATSDFMRQFYWGCLSTKPGGEVTVIETATFNTDPYPLKTMLVDPYLDPQPCPTTAVAEPGTKGRIPGSAQVSGQLSVAKGPARWLNGSHQSIVTMDGFTFTSPSIYAHFTNIKASDACSQSHIASTMLSFAPGELSTLETHLNDDPKTSVFNFADLPCPPEAVARRKWWKPERGQPYRPLIALPSVIENLNPWFSTCTSVYFSALDPPRALGAAPQLVAQAPEPAQAETTTTPDPEESEPEPAKAPAPELPAETAQPKQKEEQMTQDSQPPPKKETTSDPNTPAPAEPAPAKPAPQKAAEPVPVPAPAPVNNEETKQVEPAAPVPQQAQPAAPVVNAVNDPVNDQIAQTKENSPAPVNEPQTNNAGAVPPPSQKQAVNAPAVPQQQQNPAPAGSINQPAGAGSQPKQQDPQNKAVDYSAASPAQMDDIHDALKPATPGGDTTPATANAEDNVPVPDQGGHSPGGKTPAAPPVGAGGVKAGGSSGTSPVNDEAYNSPAQGAGNAAGEPAEPALPGLKGDDNGVTFSPAGKAYGAPGQVSKGKSPNGVVPEEGSGPGSGDETTYENQDFGDGANGGPAGQGFSGNGKNSPQRYNVNGEGGNAAVPPTPATILTKDGNGKPLTLLSNIPNGPGRVATIRTTDAQGQPSKLVTHVPAGAHLATLLTTDARGKPSQIITPVANNRPGLATVLTTDSQGHPSTLLTSLPAQGTLATLLTKDKNGKPSPLVTKIQAPKSLATILTTDAEGKPTTLVTQLGAGALTPSRATIVTTDAEGKPTTLVTTLAPGGTPTGGGMSSATILTKGKDGKLSTIVTAIPSGGSAVEATILTTDAQGRTSTLTTEIGGSANGGAGGGGGGGGGGGKMTTMTTTGADGRASTLVTMVTGGLTGGEMAPTGGAATSSGPATGGSSGRVYGGSGWRGMVPGLGTWIMMIVMTMMV